MEIKSKFKKNYIILLFFLIFVIRPYTSFGELRRMDDSSMKKTVAQAGVIDFSNIDNSARLFLDIHIETIGTIDNFSAGHPEDYDLQFKNIQLGDAATDSPLTIDGLVCITDFDENNNLKRVVMGSNMLNGEITAQVNSYSGVYNEKLISGSSTENPVEQDRLPIGNMVAGELADTTFNFNNDGLFFILTNTPGISGTNRVGFRMVAGYDETTIGASNWWDHP